MASMFGSDNPGPGELPTFGADVQQMTRVREFQGLAGQEGEKVFGDLSRQLGAWYDRAAEDQGVQQGKVAGLNPNYRPDADESLLGVARRNAANAIYGNTVEAQARQSLGDAYSQWQNLPADQRDPAALAKTIAGIKNDFDTNHVFPTIQGQFDNSFSQLSQAYLKNAQADLDKRQQDQAKASFLINQNSARDTSMKLASSPATPDAAIASVVAQHDAAVDAAVNNDVYSAAQAVEIKAQFKQDVLEQRVKTLYDNTPDDQKGSFAAAFTAKYQGVGSETQNQLAQRIQALAPTLKNAECVELARKAGGIAEGVSDWRRGENALASRPPIGTPVATFLARDGSPSDRYDGGQGIGVSGNNTTHAGVVAGYTPDGGLMLWEQDVHSGGPRLTVYKPGDARGGEKDATNYFTINGAGGQPLGNRNPLALAASAAPSPSGLSADTVARLTSHMDASARALLAQAQHAQKAAVGDIDADIKQMEAGFDVTPEEWAAKRSQYGASPDPVVRQTFDTADAVRTLYAGFKGLAPANVDAKVADMKGALAQTGASPAQAQLVEAAQKYASRLREQFDRDPLSRAASDGVIPGVTPLDPSSPGNLARTLQARVAAADQVRQHYALPRAPLVTPDDKETVKALAAAGGEPMVQAAATIAQTMGPRAGEFLSQIGGDAPTFAHMGRLAALGGDPGLLRDAAWAVAQDHQQGSKLQRPAPEELQIAIGNVYGSAFRAIPDFADGAKNVASSALAAEMMREGYDPKNLPNGVAEKTLQRAAGATFIGSTQFGGVANHSVGWTGRDKVLVPSSLRADQFDSVVGQIRDADLKSLPAPPTAPDHSVMSADQLRAMRFTSIGPGVYLLSKGDPTGDDPQWVTVEGGQRGARTRFQLDLNAMEPALRQRIPGAYR